MSTDKPLILGGIELGGTTIRIVVAHNHPTNLVFSQIIDTGTPDIALQTCYKWLADKLIDSLGIGSFGPIDLNVKSKTYGSITSTPKPHWNDTQIVQRFQSLNVPIGFTTDVNSSALGELLYGEHGNDITNSAYITVGTGIGAGIICNKQCVEGLMHPESGHVLVRRHANDTYKGICPYHNDCCEGLATANSIAGRLGMHYNELKNLPDTHEIWDIVAYYLAQLCCNIIMIASPQVIVLGGGVLKRTILFSLIRKHVQTLLNGYIRVDKIINKIDTYIVPSRFDSADSKTSAGIVGVLTLAHETYKQQQTT